MEIVDPVAAAGEKATGEVRELFVSQLHETLLRWAPESNWRALHRSVLLVEALLMVVAVWELPYGWATRIYGCIAQPLCHFELLIVTGFPKWLNRYATLSHL